MGQQAICTASRLKNSNVLAVDISKASLAYAKRKTSELNVNNIVYLQADNLDLLLLNKKFYIIKSSGVLHHMGDPLQGWRVLVDWLKAEGLLKIGLYSELARQKISDLRALIKELKVDNTSIGMKKFRNELLLSDGRSYKFITEAYDFYSMSSLRDLLFHVQGLHFTILRIIECLNRLGLRFCRFEDSVIVSSFKS
ncbi:class I SAM-dependent methyltransferase [Paracoccaceae bacterium]|nr:class I SAM-dependent methyltransferase [Paracoccaceae bacterium]